MNKAIIAGPRNNGNGNDSGYATPIAPLAKLLQIVGPHQPDEAFFRKTGDQRLHRINGVARAQFTLNCRSANRSMASELARMGEAGRERGHARFGLERVAGADQPPHFIQPQSLCRKQRYGPVPAMRGIKRSAEQADGVSGQARTPASSTPALLWRRAVSTVATMPSASNPARAYCTSGFS